MSTTRHTNASASVVAASLRDASFVRIVTRSDGDGVAAAGNLGRALAGVDIPFQVSVGRTIADRARRVEGARSAAAAGDVVATIGGVEEGPRTEDTGHDDVIRIDAVAPERPASVAAWSVAAEVDTADPVLALAGVVAAGASPPDAGDVFAAATDAGLERRPGIALPVGDPVDGLAYSTLLHAPFSGDPDAVEAHLGEVVADPPADEGAHSDLASAVVLSIASADATDRGLTAIERTIRPYVSDGPVPTVGGYADVLSAAARFSPGTGIALALGHDAVTPALTTWREHARDVHRAVRSATTARYDGLQVARLADGGPVATVAPLIRAYRSPEPVVLVVAPDEVAAVGPPDGSVGSAMRSVVAETETKAEYDATDRRAYARIDDDPDAAISAFREAFST